MLLVYYLPNREYYPQIAQLSQTEFFGNLKSVLLYASLELLSFLGMATVAKRQVGITRTDQLGFVLMNQWRAVQSSSSSGSFTSRSSTPPTYRCTICRSPGHWSPVPDRGASKRVRQAHERTAASTLRLPSLSGGVPASQSQSQGAKNTIETPRPRGPSRIPHSVQQQLQHQQYQL